MRTLNYNMDIYGTASVEEYRPAPAAGLPPRPRRRHRCPLGLRLNDLLSMGAVVMTLAAAGLAVAGL